MPSVDAEARVHAPLERVWAVLADVGGISRWNPLFQYPYLTIDGSGRPARHAAEVEVGRIQRYLARGPLVR